MQIAIERQIDQSVNPTLHTRVVERVDSGVECAVAIGGVGNVLGHHVGGVGIVQRARHRKIGVFINDGGKIALIRVGG